MRKQSLTKLVMAAFLGSCAMKKPANVWFKEGYMQGTKIALEYANYAVMISPLKRKIDIGDEVACRQSDQRTGIISKYNFSKERYGYQFKSSFGPRVDKVSKKGIEVLFGPTFLVQDNEDDSDFFDDVSIPPERRADIYFKSRVKVEKGVNKVDNKALSRFEWGKLHRKYLSEAYAFAYCLENGEWTVKQARKNKVWSPKV